VAEGGFVHVVIEPPAASPPLGYKQCVFTPLLRLPFAVFFADEAAVGVTRVDAPDSATAEAMVMEEHPGAKVHAVDGSAVTEENRVRMLGAWLRQHGQ